MRVDYFVSLLDFIRSTIREISQATENNCTKQRYPAFNSYNEKLKVAQFLLVMKSSYMAQDLTHALCHNMHLVCIHRFFVSVSFFYVFN